MILTLLVIPFNLVKRFLLYFQFRETHFGPYVVDEKLSDLNYVIVTPDRR